MNTLLKFYNIVKTNGIGFCAYRAGYALRKKTGLLKRRFPLRSWEQTSLADWIKADIDPSLDVFFKDHRNSESKYFFESGEIAGLNKKWQKEIASQANKIMQNRFTWFFNLIYDLGPEPDWFLNPNTGRRIRANRHWCDIKFFDTAVGDIKWFWEPSRFAWGYALIRAYAATGEEQYAEKFWPLLKSWMAANPPNTGPSYACGQECAIRLMVMTFAYYSLRNSPSCTNERLASLILAIAVHADRIEKNIQFAISTRTNHSITESVGIYTAGLLFPEFKDAQRWKSKGLAILAKEVERQIYADGSYVQHSVNYHRLMLDDVLWAVALAEKNNEKLPAVIYDKLAKALAWLISMTDEKTGKAPNYGSNDGAWILPLSCCDYSDYRPVIQAVHYAVHQRRYYDPGPWDEKILWLFGPKALDAPKQQPDRMIAFTADQGGYYLSRGPASRMMIRCHTYRDRPAQADMLHLDLGCGGQNILRDAGSYLYYCDPPWDRYFIATRAHNTVEIDREDQMIKGPRFLWFRWTRSKLRHFVSSTSGRVCFFQGEHSGYSRLPGRPVHRRSVCRIDDNYLVLDELLGGENHDLCLRWRLYPTSWEIRDHRCSTNLNGRSISIRIQGPKEISFDLIQGRENPPEGWESLYYAQKTQVPILVCQARESLPTRFLTTIRMDGLEIGEKDFESSNINAPVVLMVKNDKEIAEEINGCAQNIFHCIME
jgi:hypothetical protein